MQFDDLKRELSKLKGKVNEAQDLFQERQFKSARDLLLEIMELMEEAHPENHPDFLLCLGLLGDCHYELNEYGQAADCFTRSLKIKETHPDAKLSLLQCGFKLARCLDKAGQIERAAQVYQDLLDSQKNALDSSQGLKEIIYTSYEKCLRRLGKTPRECKKILSKEDKRKKAKFLTEPYKLDCQIQDFKAYSEATADSSTANKLRIKELKPSVNPVEAVKQLLSGLALLAVAALLLFTFKGKQSEVETISKPFASTSSLSNLLAELKGKRFVSIDRTDAISFDQNESASYTRGGITSPLTCVDKTATSTFPPKELKKLKLKGNQLWDEEGARYLQEGDPELKLADRLESVSKKLEVYYLLNQQYPKDEGTFREVLAADLNGVQMEIINLGQFPSESQEIEFRRNVGPLLEPCQFDDGKLGNSRILIYYATTRVVKPESNFNSGWTSRYRHASPEWEAPYSYPDKLVCLRGVLPNGTVLRGKHSTTLYLISLMNGKRILGRNDAMSKSQVDETLFRGLCKENRLEPAPIEKEFKAISLEVD